MIATKIATVAPYTVIPAEAGIQSSVPSGEASIFILGGEGEALMRYSERSAAKAKNLRCLSQRKADTESSYAAFTPGHDTSAALALWSCGLDFRFLATLGMTGKGTEL